MTKSNEEIIRQLRRGANREVALSLLYQNNKPALYQIAMKYGKYKHLDDLMQEGFIGLLRAVETYDPTHDSGASFFTYAMPWIEQAVARSLSLYEPMRLPEHARQRYFKYRRVYTDREKKGLPCDREAMAKALHWSIQKTEEVEGYEKLLNQASLETPVGSEDDTFLMDMIPSTENLEEMALEPLCIDYRNALLWSKINKLPREDREIIISFYIHDETLGEIARRLQHKKHSIIHKRDKALERLSQDKDLRRLAKQEDFIQAVEKTKMYPYHPVKAVLNKASLDEMYYKERLKQEEELERLLKSIEKLSGGEAYAE